MQPFLNSIVYRSKEGIIRERKATLMKFRKKLIGIITALTILVSGSMNVMAAEIDTATENEGIQYTVYTDSTCTEVVSTGVISPRIQEYAPVTLTNGQTITYRNPSGEGYTISAKTRVYLSWKLNRTCKISLNFRGENTGNTPYSFLSKVQNYGASFMVNTTDKYSIHVTNLSSDPVTITYMGIEF